MRAGTLGLTFLTVALCAASVAVAADEDLAYWETPAWAVSATSTRWLFPLMPEARHETAGFRALLRITNDSDREGHVRITGWDDAGKEHGPRTLFLQPRQSVNLTASELETGDGDAFPVGLGDGEGWWRLALDSALDFRAGVWSRIGESLASLGTGIQTLTNTPLPAERASACTAPGTWGAIAYGFRDQSCSTESVAWFFAVDEAGVRHRLQPRSGAVSGRGHPRLCGRSAHPPVRSTRLRRIGHRTGVLPHRRSGRDPRRSRSRGGRELQHRDRPPDHGPPLRDPRARCFLRRQPTLGSAAARCARRPALGGAPVSLSRHLSGGTRGQCRSFPWRRSLLGVGDARTRLVPDTRRRAREPARRRKP